MNEIENLKNQGKFEEAQELEKELQAEAVLTAKIEKLVNQKITKISSVDDYENQGYVDLELENGQILSFTNYTLYGKSGEVLEHTFDGIN